MTDTGPTTEPRKSGRQRIEAEIVVYQARLPRFVVTWLKQLSLEPASYMHCIHPEVVVLTSDTGLDAEKKCIRTDSLSLTIERILRTFIITGGYKNFPFERARRGDPDDRSPQAWTQVNARITKELSDKIFVPKQNPGKGEIRQAEAGLCTELWMGKKGVPVTKAAFALGAVTWFAEQLAGGKV
jgi:hypothetical protein